MTITRTCLLLGAGAAILASTGARAQAQGSGIRVSKERPVSESTVSSTVATTAPAASSVTTRGDVSLATPFALSSYANMTESNMLAHLLSGDSLEIEIASLAQTKATHSRVRDFASMLVTEHRDHLARGLRMTPDEHITPMPMASDPEGVRLQETLNALRSMSPGDSWDAAFLRANIQHHQNDYDLLRINAKNAHDDDFEAFVGATQVTLMKHRDTAKSLATQLGFSTP
jgi:putative membrane protein